MTAPGHICPFFPFDDVRLSYQKATDGHVSNQSDPNFRSSPHKLRQNLDPQHPPLPQHQPKIDRYSHIGDEAEHQQCGHPNILEASPQQRDADDRKVAAETIIAEIDAALAAGGGADG